MNLRRLIAALLGLLCIAAAGPENRLLIRGAHLFDGTGAAAHPADVLIMGDRIVAIGPGLRTPARTTIIDGRGATLMPGLSDLHTHLRSPGAGGPDDLGKAYASLLLHGVTTAADLSLSGEMLAPIRQMTASGPVISPKLALAVRFGVPGGHGTERGWGDLFTMEASTPRQANLMVDRALAYWPDVIKVFADGWRYGRVPDINSMDLPTLRAIVERAHAAGVPVITHTVTVEGARTAAAAGVDALAHGIGDGPVDEPLIALMRANNTAYIPTMAAFESQRGRQLIAAELGRLAAPERVREVRRRSEVVQPTPELEVRRWRFLQENLRRLKQAGIRIGVGTDSGISGVYHGSATIREMRHFVSLGFTPAEALAAATSVNAAILRRGSDRGTVQVGQRADLILVAGRPDKRIEDLYRLRRVILGGRLLRLRPLRRMVDSEAASPLPTHVMSGPIDSGGGADGRTDLGTLPFTTFEPGLDHSHMDIARRVGPGRTFLVARMGADPEPRAALVLPFTPGPVQLADARGFAGFAIEVRGTGDYALLLDSYGVDARASFRTSFGAGLDMAELRIPFAAFRSPDAAARLDLARLRALIIQLEGEPGGSAWLELGRISFYRAD